MDIKNLLIFINLELNWDLLSKLSTAYLLILSTYLLTHYSNSCPKWIKKTFKVVAIDWTFLIVLPPIIPLYILLLLHRGLLRLYFKWILNDKIKLMDGIDAACARERYAQSNCAHMPFILKGIVNLKSYQQAFTQNVLNKKDKNDNYIYERLYFRVRKIWGFYCWEKCDKFDITQHIRLLEMDNQSENEMKEYSDCDIFHQLSKIADEPMPSDIPPWVILVVPNFVYHKGKNEKYYSIVLKASHSIMDGFSGTQMLANTMFSPPISYYVDPCKQMQIHFGQKIFIYLKAFLLGPPDLMSTMTAKDKNCFHRKPITGPKHFAWSRPIHFDVIKKITMKAKTSITAVSMCAVAGALRKVGVNKGFDIPQKVLATSTVALLPYPHPDEGLTNRFTCVTIPLETGMGDSLERLQVTHQATVENISLADAIFHFEMFKLVGTLPHLIADEILSRVHVTLMYSGVPFYREAVCLKNGDQLVDAAVILPIRSWIGISASTMSYNGRVRATFTCDKACLEDEDDVSLMAQSFEQEICVLAQAAGIHPDQIFIPLPS